jgi:hypothetical protein
VNAVQLNVPSAAASSVARLAGLALLLLLLGACVVIPIPNPNDFVGTHKGVPDSVVRGIQPGTTTRADVLLQLSEPWIRGSGDGYFVYSWVESLGGGGAAALLLVYPVGGTVGGVVETGFKCHCLVIQFSDLGQVERVTVISKAGTAVDMTVFPCPDEGTQEAIQQWLAQSPARR